MPERRRTATLRFLASPTDQNLYGKVHGGVVMKWIDEAGYACAAGWSGQLCVTVYVGGIRFWKPVLLGNIVEVNARLIYTGNTSMHIAVEVLAGEPQTGEYIRTTSCIIVFVAIDNEGRGVTVPTWEPATAEEAAERDYAVRLMALRKQIEELAPSPVPVPDPSLPVSSPS